LHDLFYRTNGGRAEPDNFQQKQAKRYGTGVIFTVRGGMRWAR
jgi:hypothetical protein